MSPRFSRLSLAPSTRRITAVVATLAFAAGACEGPVPQRQPHLDGIGVEHNRTLAFLESTLPPGQAQPLQPEGFGRILEAAQSYYVGERGFDGNQVGAVAAEVVRVLDAAGLVQDNGGRHSIDLGDSPESLLRAVDVLAREGRISTRLADALHRTWAAGTKLQDADALLAFIDREFSSVTWSKEDQLVVDAFVQTARYSADYWDHGGDNGPAAQRIPRWVTILADALGGAVGGAAGAAAGGPIGAAIGAGLFGAAVSSVFSIVRPTPPGDGGPGPR
jgi:hypothetical protein